MFGSLVTMNTCLQQAVSFAFSFVVTETCDDGNATPSLLLEKIWTKGGKSTKWRLTDDIIVAVVHTERVAVNAVAW